MSRSWKARSHVKWLSLSGSDEREGNIYMEKKKMPDEILFMKSELVAKAFTILMEAYVRMIGRTSSG